MNKLYRSMIEDAAVTAGIDSERIRWDAAGSFRDGRTHKFFAFTGTWHDVARFFAQLGISVGRERMGDFGEEDLEEMTDSIIWDSMGHNMIFGFPGIEIADTDKY